MDEEIYTTVIAEDPNYENLILMRDIYFDMGGFEDKTYVRKYENEESEDYEDRTKDVFYENVFTDRLDSFISPVFSNDITRSSGDSESVDDEGESLNELDEELQMLIDDVDNAGTSMTDFVENTQLFTWLYGAAFVLTDAPEEVPESAADIGRESMPYAKLFAPIDLVEYGLNKYGALVYIKYIEKYGEDKEDEDQIEYRVYKKKANSTGGMGITYKIKKEDEFDKRDLAIFPVRLEESNKRFDKKKIAPPKFKSAGKNAQQRLNIQSFFMDVFKNVTFPIFTFQSEKANADESGEEVVQLGPKRSFAYQEGATRPAFVTPDSQPVNSLRDEYSELRDSQIESVNASASVGKDTGVEARIQADRNRIEKLRSNAKSAEKLEMWIVTVGFQSFSEKELKYSVYYNKSFQMLTTDLMIDSIQKVVDIGVNDQVRDRLVKFIFENIFSEQPELVKELNELVDQGGNNDGEEEQDLSGESDEE